NLTRVGEKANYDYLVRWVHNARQRTRPYCPYEKKDIGPEDYAKKGLPYVFDLQHSQCPNDGHELQVQNMTVMPSLRLSVEEAQRGGKDPITNPEDLARLPNGPAKGPWYNHKGFFEHKLAEPEVYDKGMVKSNMERLRMPNVHLNKDQIRSLTTFLLGSQETSLPASYQYKPADSRRDIQEGWWVVKKYNCMGCHQFIPGQPTTLMGMERYKDVQEQLPPKLLTEGARVDPEWLRRFLSNPALSTNDTNRNGVRSYLQVRMPTFSFSDNELRKLVRFFQALSQQPMPYIPEQVPMLTAKESDMARS